MGHGVSAGTSLALRRRPLDSLSRALLQLSIRSQAIAYPGLLLIVVTGVWMGFVGSWWRTGWIWTAIAVLVVVFIAMSVMSVPYHRARAEKAESSAAADTPLARSRPLPLLAIGCAGLFRLTGPSTNPKTAGAIAGIAASIFFTFASSAADRDELILTILNFAYLDALHGDVC